MLTPYGTDMEADLALERAWENQKLLVAGGS